MPAAAPLSARSLAVTVLPEPTPDVASGAVPELVKFMSGRGLPEPVKALEGKSALVLDRVARYEGQVKLDGEIWTARPYNQDDVYEPGDHVTVVHIDGATAVVQKVV